MGFFEKPVLQTQLLLENLEIKIKEISGLCDVGIIDRYLTGIKIYQTNKATSPSQKSKILKLIKEKEKILPSPLVTFILDISYTTLCQRYLKRYNMLPKEEHKEYLKKIINSFSKAEGYHIDNNGNLEKNLDLITEISLEKILEQQ